MEHQPIIIERTFQAPISIIWKAISDRDEMAKWYFDLKEFKTEVGFEFKFTAGEKFKPYTHLCKILEVIPNKKLTYSWRYEGYEGDSFVTFELFEEPTGTRVKLTHVGLETFPISNPDFAKENFEGGWLHIIGTGLKEYLK